MARCTSPSRISAKPSNTCASPKTGYAGEPIAARDRYGRKFRHRRRYRRATGARWLGGHGRQPFAARSSGRCARGSQSGVRECSRSAGSARGHAGDGARACRRAVAGRRPRRSWTRTAGAEMWRLHVDAACRLAEAIAPRLGAGGRIVLVGSRVSAGAPGKSQYAASKAAMVGSRAPGRRSWPRAALP